jgi:hypothetical protein
MKVRHTSRLAIFIAGAFSGILAWSVPALAQCALCKNAVTGSPDAGKLSQSLNFAILVLLIPPVLIFCGLFFLAYRFNKSRKAHTLSSTEVVDERVGEALGKSSARKKNQNKRETGGALA